MMKNIIVSAIATALVLAAVVFSPFLAFAKTPEAPQTRPTAHVEATAQTGVTSGITKTQALQIALDDAGYVMDDTLYTKVKKNRDDGMEVYNVEFRVGFVTHQYEISVVDGQILDFDIDD